MLTNADILLPWGCGRAVGEGGEMEGRGGKESRGVSRGGGGGGIGDTSGGGEGWGIDWGNGQGIGVGEGMDSMGWVGIGVGSLGIGMGGGVGMGTGSRDGILGRAEGGDGQRALDGVRVGVRVIGVGDSDFWADLGGVIG